MFRTGTYAVPGYAPEVTVSEKGVTIDIRSGFADQDLVVSMSGLDAKPDAVFVKDGAQYRPLAFLPLPKAEEADKPLALKVLVDCSGSMSGSAIREARSALRSLAGLLTDKDRAALAAFGLLSVMVYSSDIQRGTFGDCKQTNAERNYCRDWRAVFAAPSLENPLQRMSAWVSAETILNPSFVDVPVYLQVPEELAVRLMMKSRRMCPGWLDVAKVCLRNPALMRPLDGPDDG